MKRFGKVVVGVGILFIAAIAHIPIATEVRVRMSESLLGSEHSLNVIKENFGNPTEIRTDLSDSSRYSKRRPILIQNGEELWVFNREGIPYWNILIVTEDGETAKAWQVNRLW